MDYSKKSNEQLLEESHELNEKRMALKAEMKAIAEELDRRAAQKKLDTMNDAEKDHLRQVLGTGGIESAETIGEPGT